MNGSLLVQTFRWHAVRMLLLGAAALGWGWLIMFIYTTFSEVVRQMVQDNPLMQQMSQFGSGNFFSVPGAVTLGFQHPFAIAIIAVIAVGSGATIVAGERQRGTLEVLLARPISRRTLVVTLVVALFVLVAILTAAFLVGLLIGMGVHDLATEVDLGLLPLAFLSGFLLWAAFSAFSLAASVSFDRTGPAIGLAIAFLLVNYLLEILGSLWTDVQWSQAYSLIHHFQPGEILAGNAEPLDFLILALATAVPVAYALIVFPRRDIAAPA